MFNKDIGIDLGTVNILVYVKGEGIIVNEPSVIVIDEQTKKPIAFGEEANRMLGRTPGKIKAIKPMKDGVIADFEMVETLLSYLLRKINIKKQNSKTKNNNMLSIQYNRSRKKCYKRSSRKNRCQKGIH